MGRYDLLFTLAPPGTSFGQPYLPSEEEDGDAEDDALALFTVPWEEVTIAEEDTESVTPKSWEVVATTGDNNVLWFGGYSGKSFPLDRQLAHRNPKHPG